MKKPIVVISILFIILLGSASGIGAGSGCHYTGDEISGLNRICYYQCMDGAYAIKMGACDLCPLWLDD